MLVIGPDPVAEGCVVWLDSSEYGGSGTTWNDLSGNGQPATFGHGAVATHTAGTSGAFDFDAANERAYVNFDLTHFTTKGTTQSGTIEVWGKATDIGGGNGTVDGMLWDTGQGSNQGDEFSCRYRWSSNGYWNCYEDNSSGWSNMYAGGNGDADVAWHQVVFALDNGGTMSGAAESRTFLDGQVSNSLTDNIGTFDTNIDRITFGGQGSALNPFIGKIAIARVYNRPLTNSEVLKNFNSAKKRFGL